MWKRTRNDKKVIKKSKEFIKPRYRRVDGQVAVLTANEEVETLRKLVPPIIVRLLGCGSHAGPMLRKEAEPFNEVLHNLVIEVFNPALTL